MTDDQKNKREDIVHGMKKNFSDFRSRYGDRAKEVMYATATKQAMKENIEQIDEISAELAKRYSDEVKNPKNFESPNDYRRRTADAATVAGNAIAKKDHDDFQAAKTNMEYSARKGSNRAKGLKRAENRMAEEAEQIDELSAGLLNRAAGEARRRAHDLDLRSSFSAGRAARAYKKKGDKFEIAAVTKQNRDTAASKKSKELISAAMQRRLDKRNEEVESIDEVSVSLAQKALDARQQRGIRSPKDRFSAARSFKRANPEYSNLGAVVPKLADRGNDYGYLRPKSAAELEDDATLYRERPSRKLPVQKPLKEGYADYGNYTVTTSTGTHTVYGPGDKDEMEKHLHGQYGGSGKRIYGTVKSMEKHTGKVAPSRDPLSHRSYNEETELAETTHIIITRLAHSDKPGPRIRVTANNEEEAKMQARDQARKQNLVIDQVISVRESVDSPNSKHSDEMHAALLQWMHDREMQENNPDHPLHKYGFSERAHRHARFRWVTEALQRSVMTPKDQKYMNIAHDLAKTAAQQGAPEEQGYASTADRKYMGIAHNLARSAAQQGAPEEQGYASDADKKYMGIAHADARSEIASHTTPEERGEGSEFDDEQMAKAKKLAKSALKANSTETKESLDDRYARNAKAWQNWSRGVREEVGRALRELSGEHVQKFKDSKK